MNKIYRTRRTIMKNAMMIGLGLLMIGQAGYAQQTLTYSSIVAKYTNKQSISDISSAIKIVKEHCNNLKAQRSVYRPRVFKAVGAGLGLIAGVGIIGSIAGISGAMYTLDDPENSKAGEWLLEQPEKFQETVRECGLQSLIKYLPLNKRGLSYSEALKSFYFGVPYEGRKDITVSYVNSISDDFTSIPLLYTGLAAPVVLPVSVMLAGLSQYLLNKAASYDNQALEDLIAQDEKMIMDLRAQKAMLS